MWVAHNLEDCCNCTRDKAEEEEEEEEEEEGNADHIANAAMIKINHDASTSSKEE